MSKASLLALADRVEAQRGFDNSIDVECEIALFQADNCELAIRANAAGSKVIVTINGRADRTFLARDYTMSKASRAKTAATLRARASMEEA